MKNKLKEWMVVTVIASVGIFLAWLMVAEMVFSFRHPWATDTERILHTYEAMTFQKVPYNQARPRE